VPSDHSSTSEDLAIWQVKYGERSVLKSEVFDDFAALGVPDGSLAMDYNFWVLRGSAGTILYDTGYDIARRDWLGEISTTPPPVGLELIGVDPAAVDLVITSHFHYDHIGYLHLFTNARVVAAQAEYDFWFAKLAANGLAGEFATVADVQAVAAARDAGRLELVTEPAEVHPGLHVYPIGGHCPGQLLLRADGPSGSTILASDAAHFYEQVEHGWPFFAYTDRDAMIRGFDFIRELARSTAAVVVPGHDGRVRDLFPAAPGPAAAVATVLA
jgi:glyoxylase-like metal-dependent hydrolase (beta-lactamase superfamily II)